MANAKLRSPNLGRAAGCSYRRLLAERSRERDAMLEVDVTCSNIYDGLHQLTKQSKNWCEFNAIIFTHKKRQRHCFEHKKKYGGVIPLLALITIIASALGAAGGVAGGVANAVSAPDNARAAATAQAELERHNREVEAQLKAGSEVISDYAGKTPKIGNIKTAIAKVMLRNWSL